MGRIEVSSQVGPDGVLNFNLPLGADEANRQVRVTIEAADSGPVDFTTWQRGIRETAGSISDETFRRHPQGEYKEREELFS